MKKIVLLPKTDTVILCLPEQWVGIPVICKLIPMPGHPVDKDEIQFDMERIINFRNHKRRRKSK